MNREPIRNRRQRGYVRPLLELLEARLVLNIDYGDAMVPYKTLLAEGGPSHNAVGPTLGPQRDIEADGAHSVAANADDISGSPDDEDGVLFGTMRAGQLGATATVRVAGGPAELNAWIDFNRDGAWGGPGEHIAKGVNVVSGDNAITFDVPSSARDGSTYARFRVSTAGDLAPAGAAQNGEVEDYVVTVLPPKASLSLFTTHNISITADSARSVFAADMDGDGDMDALSASDYDNEIAWHENDGNQNFTAHIIYSLADSAQSVYAADVDGDGDMDALSASEDDNKIVWYENNGSQVFTPRIISQTPSGANSVFAADVDSDGDMDILSASRVDDRIAWFENNGSQVFTLRTITTQANRAHSVYAADVDSDGDMDVLSASAGDSKIAWYENNGSQVFTTRIITVTMTGANSVFATDLDGDGDIDVLSAAINDARITWYENNGSQVFTARTIYTAIDQAYGVYAADVDGDGDTDVLGAFSFFVKIAWFENDGNQNFTTRPITITAADARSVFAADVDNDGDMDVLSASKNDDKIAWYENSRAKSHLLQDNPVGPPIVPIPPPLPTAHRANAATLAGRASNYQANLFDFGNQLAPVVEREHAIRHRALSHEHVDAWDAGFFGTSLNEWLATESLIT